MANLTSKKVWVHRPAPLHDRKTPTLMLPIELGDALNAGAFGGTATVHKIRTQPYHYMAAKVFNEDALVSRRTPDVHDKLVFIAAASEALKRGYVRGGKLVRGRPHIAWPEALLYDAHVADPDHLVGFTMPMFADSAPLSRLTSPKQRKSQFPQLPVNGLSLAARNIAGAVADLHGIGGRSGIVIGDLTPRNILIRTNLACQLIDADSYQFSVGSKVWGSADSTPGFRSPWIAEAARAGGALPVFSLRDDAYALAIVLFHVLVDGAHPWTAGERFEVNGIKPDEEDNMLAGRFPYADPGSCFPPKIRLQTYQKLPVEVRQLFELAFIGNAPPSPAQWVDVLALAHLGTSAPAPNRHRSSAGAAASP